MKKVTIQNTTNNISIIDEEGNTKQISVEGIRIVTVTEINQVFYV